MVASTAHNTTGALQIGISFAIFLFGIVTVQTYHYYVAFPGDRASFRYLVGFIWILELGHTAGISYEIYTTTVTREGALHSFPGLGAALLLGGVITMLVQGFFARRLWKLLPRPYNFVGPVCMFIAFLRCIGSTFLSSQALVSKNIAIFRSQWDWLITALLSVGAALDVAIAGSMLYFLARKRQEALNRVAQLLDHLVAYTIRTGLFTSIAAVLVLICFQVMPGNFVWIGTYTFLAKLYSNSLLAALMERQELRNTVYGASQPSNPAFKNPSNNYSLDQVRSGAGRHVISIEMRPTADHRDDLERRGYWREPPGSPQSPTKVYFGANEKYI